MTKNEFKFKIGDIVIQRNIINQYIDIFKILGYSKYKYYCAFIMSGGYYEKGRIVELNMYVIENGSTAWLPARLLTDEDKVELL